MRFGHAGSTLALIVALIAVGGVAADTEWMALLAGEWSAADIEAAEPTYTVQSAHYSAARNETLVQFTVPTSVVATSTTLDNELLDALGVAVNVSANARSVNKALVTSEGCASGLSWALDRIDQRSKTLNSCYTVTYTGAGSHVYVIDTGIHIAHSQFGGRATQDFTTLGSHTDCDGHGTHVAGLVGAADYGSAPGAFIHAVRVLDCSGSGTLGDLAAGLLWVRDHYVAPAVVNLSLGYSGHNSLIASIISDLDDAGVVVVAASGNGATTACNHFPSAHATVVSVSAIAQGDARASFSNYGANCVTLFAPGQSVRSTWNNGGTVLLSGTSMASPLVAGVVALLFDENASRSPATIRSLLVSQASLGYVTNAQGTPNRLVYAALDATPAPTSSATVSSSAAPAPASASRTRTPTPSRSRSSSPNSFSLPSPSPQSGSGSTTSSAAPALSSGISIAVLCAALATYYLFGGSVTQ